MFSIGQLMLYLSLPIVSDRRRGGVGCSQLIGSGKMSPAWGRLVAGFVVLAVLIAVARHRPSEQAAALPIGPNAPASESPTIVDPWKQGAPPADSIVLAPGEMERWSRSQQEWQEARAARALEGAKIALAPYPTVSVEPTQIHSPSEGETAATQYAGNTRVSDSGEYAPLGVSPSAAAPGTPQFVGAGGARVRAIPLTPNSYEDRDTGRVHHTFDRGDGVQQAYRRPIDAFNEAGAALDD